MKYLDTYALVEIHNGNPEAEKYLEENAVVGDLTMAEFYYVLYKKYDEKTADYWHRKLSFLVEKIPIEAMIEGVKFRYDNKEEEYSFFDAVGYKYARKEDMTFVTGGKEFKGREGVEIMRGTGS